MNYENIAMGTSGAMWVSGNYVDGCMAAGGPCPPELDSGRCGDEGSHQHRRQAADDFH